MSRGKWAVEPNKIIDAGDASLTLTSKTINTMYTDNIGIEYVPSGNPSGEISVYASVSGLNFKKLTMPKININPTTQPDLINLNNLPYSNIKIVFTPFSNSTGNLDVWLCSKGI